VSIILSYSHVPFNNMSNENTSLTSMVDDTQGAESRRNPCTHVHVTLARLTAGQLRSIGKALSMPTTSGSVNDLRWVRLRTLAVTLAMYRSGYLRIRMTRRLRCPTTREYSSRSIPRVRGMIDTALRIQVIVDSGHLSPLKPMSWRLSVMRETSCRLQ